MQLTDYHAKYIAYQLTRRCPPDSVEKFAAALADAQVDLNPHQIDAALFAFRSPLSKGALLADEVGLGKTIEAEADKLEGWADDLKVGLEREIKELDRQIKDARRAATTALTLEDKLAGQKQIRTLEAQRNEKRRSLFDAQDRVDSQCDQLIQAIEGKLTQSVKTERLFAIRWVLQ